MKLAVAIIIDTLHALALALWLGGLALLTLAVNRTVATALPAPEAARVSLETLRLLGAIAEVGGIVMLGAQYLLRRRYQRSRPLFVADGLRQLLTFGALFLAETVRYSLGPSMRSALSANKLDDYERLYALAGTLAVGQMVLLIGVTALTAWLQLPRAVTSSSATSGR